MYLALTHACSHPQTIPMHSTFAAFFYNLYRMIMTLSKSAQEQVARVRAFNSVKLETSRNLLPVLKIVTHTVHTE